MNSEIIGICLIKNEDLFIRNVINNIYDFCDRIMVLDNKSKDRTREIINNLKNNDKLNKIRIHNVEKPWSTNKYIEKYVGRKAWIFGVDGDELYDKDRLKLFKKELMSGKYNKWWRICGSQLNVCNLNLDVKKAKGFLSPPSRWVGKLYNFRYAIGPLPQSERLHGEIKFNKKLIAKKKFSDFDNDNLRFLHLCFINRSSSNEKISSEQSINNIKYYVSINPEGTRAGIDKCTNYKILQYGAGQIVEKNIDSFF